MPAGVTEIGVGKQFSRSSNEGQLADSEVRTFRVILLTPDETIDIQNACGVRIGNPHPVNPDLYCVSFDARFEGDSRMVVAVTFNYQTSPSVRPQDPKSQSPDVRPANWTTSTSLVEVPKSTWVRRFDETAWDAQETAAANPAGDIYDGVTALEPIVAINIEQWEATDPTRHLLYAGSVNEEEITLGTLTMKPGTVMFRGVSSQPAVEAWGDLKYRGWRCSYEFAYRRNKTTVGTLGPNPIFGNAPLGQLFPLVHTGTKEMELGWDIAVPMTGFNVLAVEPENAAADEEVFGQPLATFEGKVQKGSFDADGKFTPDPNGEFQLPFNVNQNARVAAMIKVMEYEEGGLSLARAASPVALKPNGRALKTHDDDGKMINPPYVYAYRVQPSINITTTLGLRLF